MEIVIPVVSFFIGIFVSLFVYLILAYSLGEADKLIVFKSNRLTKKQRIEKLEDFEKEMNYQIRYIKSRLIDISTELSDINKKED